MPTLRVEVDLRGFRAGQSSGMYVFEVTPPSNDVDFRPRSPLGVALLATAVIAVFLQVLSVGLCYLHDPVRQLPVRG